MRGLHSTLLYLALILGATSTAMAQGGPGGGSPGGGPGPAPSPWIISGPTISYNNGGITMPSTVSGGSQGVGTINVSGGYYVGGVSIAALPCTQCAVKNATNTFLAYQVINLNSGAVPTPQTGTGWQVVGANSTTVRFEGDTYAESTRLTGIRSDGTQASPTTLLANDEILSLNAWGYDGSSVSGPAASIRQNAAGTWSTTSHGTYIDFLTTASADATKTLTSRMHIENDGGITVGGTASQGAGTLNLSGALYNSGTAPTGTGAYVRATSPSLVTPALGVASGTSLALGGCTISGNSLCTASPIMVVSGNVSALSVGVNGVTNPTFQVDASAASQVAGLKVTGAATGGTVAIAAIDSGAAANLTINAKGTGTIGIGTVSTGLVTIGANLTLSGTVVATGLASSGTCANGISIDASNNIFKGACPGAASSIQVGVTTITSGTTQKVEFNNAGVLGELTVTNGLEVSSGNLQIAASWRTNPTYSIVTTSSHTGGFSANASGSYTPPANVKYVRLWIVGAGGGGGGSGATAGSASNAGATCWNTSGSACTSPVYSAGGGGGGGGNGNPAGAGGTITGSGTCSWSFAGAGGDSGTTAISGSTGAIGGSGGYSFYGGAGGGGATNVAGQSAAANSGSGGGGAGLTSTVSQNGGSGGGAGAICFVTLSAASASGNTYTVGSGTSGGGAGTSGQGGGTGGGGIIIAEEQYGQ